MLIKIVAAALILWLIYIMAKPLIHMSEIKKSDDSEVPDVTFRYSDIDDIVTIRERLKKVENLISVCEAYSEGEHIRAIRISYTNSETGNLDAYDTFVSNELITYLYQERHALRMNLERKFSRIK